MQDGEVRVDYTPVVRIRDKSIAELVLDRQTGVIEREFLRLLRRIETLTKGESNATEGQ